MSRMDPAQRLQKTLLFAGKILPAAAQAAMVCQQMGTPFSFQKFLIRTAKEMDIDWMDEVFYDPEFQAKVAGMVEKSPQPDNAKPQQAGGGMGAIMQNGQPGNVSMRDQDTQMGPQGASTETLSGAQPAEAFAGAM